MMKKVSKDEMIKVVKNIAASCPMVRRQCYQIAAIMADAFPNDTIFDFNEDDIQIEEYDKYGYVDSGWMKTTVGIYNVDIRIMDCETFINIYNDEKPTKNCYLWRAVKKSEYFYVDDYYAERGKQGVQASLTGDEDDDAAAEVARDIRMCLWSGAQILNGNIEGLENLQFTSIIKKSDMKMHIFDLDGKLVRITTPVVNVERFASGRSLITTQSGRVYDMVAVVASVMTDCQAEKLTFIIKYLKPMLMDIDKEIIDVDYNVLNNGEEFVGIMYKADICRSICVSADSKAALVKDVMRVL